MFHKIKNAIAVFMCIMMTVSMTIPAYAMGNSGITRQELSTVDSKAIRKQDDQIEYIYLDSRQLKLGDTQYIVVSFKDTSLKVDKAVLKYIELETNEEHVLETVKIAGNAMLFEKTFGPEEKGRYQLQKIEYDVHGTMKETVFTDEQASEFYVVDEVLKEGQEETVETTTYSFDEKGEMTISDAEITEDAVAKGLKIADHSSVAQMSKNRNGELIVALAAGHDASHVGARGNGLKEEELTLKVARYCKEELEKYSGVQVYMVRNSSSCPHPGTTSSQDNNQRIENAVKAGADVYVDIHFNSGGGTGAEVYYQNPNWKPGLSKESQELADKILEELEELGLKNRGSKVKDTTINEKYPDGSLSDYYTTSIVCKENNIPGLIVEHAFLDNSDDASKLKNENFIKQLGIADATGIANKYGLTKGGNIETLSASIVDKNDFAGTFSVKLTGKGVVPSNVTKAEVTITAQNSEKTIKKTAEYDSNQNAYIVNCNKSEWGGQNGIYRIIAEVIGKSGKVLSQEQEIFVKNPTIESELKDKDGKETNYVLETTITDQPIEMTGIQTAVWTDGEDNLKWTNAKKVAENRWQTSINVNDFAMAGKYYVDTYAVLNGGKRTYLKTDSFSVTNLKIGQTEIKNYVKDQGTFEVVVSDIQSASGIEKVRIPVWCEGAGDLKWYDAHRQKDGSYKTTVSIANHKYHTGIYTIHVYVNGKNGVETSVNAGTIQVESVKAKVYAEDKDGMQQKYTLRMENPGVYGEVENVKFAVWEDTQKQVKWFEGTKVTEKEWKAEVDISEFAKAGKYYVDVYVTDTAGKEVYAGGTIFEIKAPQIGEVKIENYNKEKGTFEITIRDIECVSGIEKVQVPVWNEGQNDIKWYEAEKQWDGSYKVKADMANHKYHSGKYTVHVYVMGKNGVQTSVNAGMIELKPVETKIYAEDKDGTQQKYALKIENPGVYGEFKAVRFAVWEDNQKQVKWFTGTKVAEKEWMTEVDISQFAKAVKYYVDVYITDTAGKEIYAGGTTFLVTAPTVQSIFVENYNEEKGNFDVVISGLDSASKVNSAKVAVWIEGEQKVKWYLAIADENNTFRTTVSASDYGYQDGIYFADVYVQTQNGISQYVGGIQQKVDIYEFYSIMGGANTTVEQMSTYYKMLNRAYPAAELAKGGAATIEEFCKIIVEEAETEGVRAEVVFAQAMLETGWLKFGGIVKIEQFNFCGLGATDTNAEHNVASFPDVRTGIRAQVQHLKAYASTEKLVNVCVDPRFQFVKRGSAIYVQWLGQKENPNHAGWATSEGYGNAIVDIIRNIRKS